MYFTIEVRDQKSGKWKQINQIKVEKTSITKQEKRFLFFKWTKEIENLAEAKRLEDKSKIEAIEKANNLNKTEKDVRVLQNGYEDFFGLDGCSSYLISDEIWRNGEWID